MISVFKFFGKLPLSFLRATGFCFSWGYWFFSKKYRLRFKKNWETAMKYSNRQLDGTSLRLAVGRTGTFIFELPKIWCSKGLRDIVEVDGYAQVELLLRQGNGLICLSPHLGSFELIPRIFYETVPINILYKPSKNIFLNQILKELRPTKNIKMIEPNFSGIKKIFTALKKGEIVGLLPDQVPPYEHGITESFFGRPAHTMTLASKLILMTSAPVVWTQVHYKKSGWRVTITPWDLKKFANKDTFELTRSMNKKIEKLVLEEPESYMWGYDRYKMPRKILKPLHKNF